MATVTNPVNVFVPVAEDIVRFPLAPLPTEVVPVTVKSNPAAVNVVPFNMERLPPIMVETPMEVLVVPLVTTSLKVVLVLPPIV